MTQPTFVPISEADQMRPALRLSNPGVWTQSRPSELRGATRPSGPAFGTPGPDQGYALKLAHGFADRLVLGPGEHAEDAAAGCTGVAMRRAAAFGRAPVVHDMTLAFTLWGFLGDAPDDLVEKRRPLFSAAAHSYHRQRAIADLVAASTLRMTPDGVAARVSGGRWRELLVD